MARVFELHPATDAEELLREFGKRIRLARTRRGVFATELAQDLRISRSTMQLIEKGDPHVSVISFIRALLMLGFRKQLEAVAKVDVMGVLLEDFRKQKGSDHDSY